jgi:hypothetical protein
VHRAANQRAPVVARAVAAVQVQRARPVALRVNREVRQVKQAEPLGKLQDPRVEAERLRIALAAVPRAELTALQVARAALVVTAPYPRR